MQQTYNSTLNRRTTNVFAKAPGSTFTKIDDFNEREEEGDLFEQEANEGDQAFGPGPEEYPEPSHPKVETDEDLRRGRIIKRMEKEGLNFELFLKHVKTLRKKGNTI